MYEKVKAYIKEHNMIQAQDGILAGVSGGGDSMAMLAILKRYQKEVPFSLYVVHVHHGIRGEEADRDENVVKELCKKWELPFFPYHYDVPKLAKEWKTGLEEAGRKVRQEAFKKTQEALPQKMQVRIALAHNENDVAETLIHNLCRGTGLRGLASIQPVRGNIIRPILCLNKKEIVNYLSEEKIPYVTDSTNLEDEYTRNRIRHKVLPLLEKDINAASIHHMAETAGLVSQAEAYMAKQGASLVEKYGESRPDGIFLSEKFWQEEPVVASYGLFLVFEKLAEKRKDFTMTHIKSVAALCDLQVGRKISLPYGLTATRTYGGILLGKAAFRKNKKETIHEFSTGQKTLLVPGTTFFGKSAFFAKIILNQNQKIEEKTYTKWLDYDRIKQELSIRTRLPGDFLVVDAKGNHKKLNRYFIDEKIPSQERDEIPLLTAGSEVLWVVGGRINENYKITPRTRRILEIQYQGGKDNHE